MTQSHTFNSSSAQGTTTELPLGDVDSYDYLIVGGGTAGCVIASRLAEYLPDKRILLIEAGPSDLTEERVLDLRQWLTLLGGDLDYDYGVTEQLKGNSHVRHSRAKILGGCSSHNTLISFHPFEYDLAIWQSLGAKGWTFDTMKRMFSRLRNTIQPVHPRHRNQLCLDWLEACSISLNIPIIKDFNQQILSEGHLKEGCGFFSVSYNPENCHRSSASVAYIHPTLRGEERKSNLTVLTNAWVNKINVSNNVATGVDLTLLDGSRRVLRARAETVLCAGAIDTPRLMLLSGLGPADDLKSLGIPVVADIKGVGENLIDHPESIIMWELNKPVPAGQTTMDSDAGIFLRRERPNAAAHPAVDNSFNPAKLPDGDIADVMMHVFSVPYTLHTTRLGYDEPKDGYAFCMTPNIPRPRSRGKLYLLSSDPKEKPALDFRYYTDTEGYDAATFVWAIRQSRRVAQQAPFKDWLKREVCPGSHIHSDEALSEYARRVGHTVYHPAGTTKIGNVDNDELAVVDPQLRVKGIQRLRICDAGLFPSMPSINPMVTILCLAERAAELLAEASGRQKDFASAKL